MRQERPREISEQKENIDILKKKRKERDAREGLRREPSLWLTTGSNFKRARLRLNGMSDNG